MSRRSADTDGDEADVDPGALQERMAARGMAMRHARTGGLVAAGHGLVQHFSDPSSAMAASRQPAPDKDFATLQARLALVGWSLLADAPAGFVACRWNRAVHLADLAAVEQFAQRVGARK